MNYALLIANDRPDARNLPDNYDCLNLNLDQQAEGLLARFGRLARQLIHL